MLIGHLGDGVGVGAVEVNEPEFWDYSCGLGLDGLEVALAEPAVDGIIGIACGDDDLLDSECIGDGFEFLFKPRAETNGQRGRKSCFVRSGALFHDLCKRENGIKYRMVSGRESRGSAYRP